MWWGEGREEVRVPALCNRNAQGLRRARPTVRSSSPVGLSRNTVCCSKTTNKPNTPMAPVLVPIWRCQSWVGKHKDHILYEGIAVLQLSSHSAFTKGKKPGLGKHRFTSSCYSTVAMLTKARMERVSSTLDDRRRAERTNTG